MKSFAIIQNNYIDNKKEVIALVNYEKDFSTFVENLCDTFKKYAGYDKCAVNNENTDIFSGKYPLNYYLIYETKSLCRLVDKCSKTTTRKNSESKEIVVDKLYEWELVPYNVKDNLFPDKYSWPVISPKKDLDWDICNKRNTCNTWNTWNTWNNGDKSDTWSIGDTKDTRNTRDTWNTWNTDMHFDMFNKVDELNKSIITNDPNDHSDHDNSYDSEDSCYSNNSNDSDDSNDSNDSLYNLAPTKHTQKNNRIVDQLKKFNISKTLYETHDDSINFNYGHYLIIGKRGSGKTTTILNILEQLSWLDPAIISNSLCIAPTEKMTRAYANKFPNLPILHEYSSGAIEYYLSQVGHDKPGVIILDDCLSSKGTAFSDKIFTELVMNGRHYRKYLILSMQFPIGIKPEIRVNFDYVFLYNEDFLTNIKRLYEHYAGMFPSFDQFRDIFIKTVATNYNALVISNRGARTNFLDKVYVYTG